MKFLAVIVVALVMFAAVGATASVAQTAGSSRTVPLEDLGWGEGTEGATGSVTYIGLNDPFQASVDVKGLLPEHDYGVMVMAVAVDGTATVDDGTFVLTTDGAGNGSTELSLSLPVGEGIPAYQVHVLILDKSQPQVEPLPNPLGVPFSIQLACRFPLGFRVGDVNIAQPAIDDTTISLVNLGFAPGFDGGAGSLSWDPNGDSFEADVSASDLLPNQEYKIYVMASAVDGGITLDSTSFPVTTDANGAFSTQVSLTPPTDGLPVPAFQVHILVVDETVTLDEPLPNPLGIPNPIALACEFPAGFLALSLEAATPAPPAVGSGLASFQGDDRPGPQTSWLVFGAAAVTILLVLSSGALLVRRRP